MKILRTLGFVIVIFTLAVLWYQKTYPQKLEHMFYPLEYKESIAQASKDYSIDPHLICAIIYVESKFNPRSESNAGAVGLMQVMPQTGQWIAKKQGRPFSVSDLNDPATNIDMGTWYFRYLKSKYGNDKLALAAYNSGFRNVDRWLKNNSSSTVDEMVTRIPFEETRAFVVRVKSAEKMYKKLYPDEFNVNYAGKRRAISQNP